MGGIVEAAFWGIAGRLVICFVLLPAGLILLGYLIFIFCFYRQTVPSIPHGDNGVLQIGAGGAVYHGI